MKAIFVFIAVALLGTVAAAAQDSTPAAADSARLTDCNALKVKLAQNKLLTDEEIQKLTNCEVAEPVCGGTMCEADIQKIPAPGGIGTDWNKLIAG